jgi:hypothetical protein
MIFTGPVTMPHGGIHSHHIITKLTVDVQHNRFVVELSSWQTSQAAIEGYQGERHSIQVAFDDVSSSQQLIDEVTTALLSEGGPLFGATPAQPDETDLEAVRAAKLKSITHWRAKANEVFTHVDKTFSADAISWKDITGVQGYVARKNELPPGFPGAWKSVDGSFHSIPTVEEWDAFYASATATGTANFIRSETLKAQAMAAETVAAINTLQWEI